jgi:hypothetical protein
MKTEILKQNGSWQDVVDACRSTVSKPPLGKDPGCEFKTTILIAEHSPIREIGFKWRWKNIKSWIATHWSRHMWECYISTQRTDRTGVVRDKLYQDAPVIFRGNANAQHLIDTMRKRLCGQASIETREYAEDLKIAIGKKDIHIANVLVPNCVYRCGCPEENMCKQLIWVKFKQWCFAQGIEAEKASIRRRYELYNEWFYDVWMKEKNHE